MTLRYLTPAEEELREIISYYDDRQKSLGGRFWKGYLDALEVLKTFPEIGPEVDRERKIRKFVLSSSFPSSILYGLEEDTMPSPIIVGRHVIGVIGWILMQRDGNQSIGLPVSYSILPGSSDVQNENFHEGPGRYSAGNAG